MFFLHFVFLGFLSFFAGFTADTSIAGQEEYCNERFEFCVTYPGDYFSDIIYADNGDGIALYAQEGAVEVDIMGAYNIMGYSVEGIIDDYFETMKRKPAEAELLELHTDEAYGWAKMKYDLEIQLIQINLLNETYVTTLITVPASSPELLEELRDSVLVTFPI